MRLEDELTMLATRPIVRVDIDAWVRDELPGYPTVYHSAGRYVVPGGKHGPTIVYADENDGPDIREHDLARAFIGLQIRRAGYDPVRIKTGQEYPLSLSPPSYWDGRHEVHDVIQVDLAAAYYEIWSRLPSLFGWWHRDRFSFTTRVPLVGRKLLADHAGARNTVVGMLRASTQLRYHHGTESVVRTPPRSSGLWGVIMVVLRNIAYVAEKLGAHQISADQYVLPATDKAAGAFLWWLKREAANIDGWHPMGGLPYRFVHHEKLAIDGPRLVQLVDGNPIVTESEPLEVVER